MFTDVTYQDWLATDDVAKAKLLKTIVDTYKASAEFRRGVEAQQYFRGENPTVASKVILQAGRYKVDGTDESGHRTTKYVERKQEVVGARISSSFLFRFVTQQNQFLLANGCQLESEETKARLGYAFDTQLAQLGEQALLCGVAWGYWNLDHLEMISAAADENTGFVALLDEATSQPMVGVQFWQISPSRPLHVRLFELDGVSIWRKDKDDDVLRIIEPKRAYVVTINRDAAGESISTSSNYATLPVIPLYGNSERRSELTSAIKAKIDAYDSIASDFADNLDKANDVYWVLNNFGGNLADMQDMIDTVRRTGILASISDGMSSSTAEPHAFKVPYEARKVALALLEKSLYKDFMCINLDEITGGSLTNVAIRAAMSNLNLKADRYEWQVRSFVQQLLSLLGIKTGQIRFKRSSIANDHETVDDISAMLEYIDDRTALKLNPYVDDEDIDDIIDALNARRMSGYSDARHIDDAIRQLDQEEAGSAPV